METRLEDSGLVSRKAANLSSALSKRFLVELRVSTAGSNNLRDPVVRDSQPIFYNRSRDLAVK